MEFKKVTGKSMFRPSFGAKKGTTEFYQATENGEILGEIEIKPGTTPEIMSVFSDYRGRGVGRFLVDQIKRTIGSEIKVRATDESFPFWKKMGFKPTEGLNMIWRPKTLEHIMMFESFSDEKEYPCPNMAKSSVWMPLLKKPKEDFTKTEISFLKNLIDGNTSKIDFYELGPDHLSDTKNFSYPANSILIGIYPVSDEGNPGGLMEVEIIKFDDGWFYIRKEDPHYSNDEAGHQRIYVADQFEEVLGFLQQHTNLNF